MAQGNLTQTCKTEYNENILPEAAGFNDTGVTINKTAGTGGSSATYSTEQHFNGSRSIKSYNNSSSTELVFDLGSALDTTIPRTGTYILSMRVMHLQANNDYVPLQLNVAISVDGVIAGQSMDITLPVTDPSLPDQENLPRLKWHTFHQSFDFDANAVVNFQFTHVHEPNSSGNSTMYIDGLKLEIDDRNQNGIPSIYSEPIN